MATSTTNNNITKVPPLASIDEVNDVDGDNADDDDEMQSSLPTTTTTMMGMMQQQQQQQQPALFLSQAKGSYSLPMEGGVVNIICNSGSYSLTSNNNDQQQQQSYSSLPYINSTSNKNLIILTNDPPPPPLSLSPLPPQSSSSCSVSPASSANTSCSSSLLLANTTTTTATTITTSIGDDDFNGGDTGFFSTLSCSSKRSSIDIIDSYASIQQQHLHLNLSDNHYGGKYTAAKDNGDDGDDDDDDDERHLLLTPTPGDDDYGGEQDKNCDNLLSTPNVTHSKSLENLVNCFDEKVNHVLRNLEENVQKLAPVQMRTQEEVIKDRPAWYTLTGHYGNIMPIDWTKYSPEMNRKNENINRNGTGSIFGSNNGEQLNDKQDEEEEEETMMMEGGDDNEDIALRHLIDYCLEREYTNNNNNTKENDPINWYINHQSVDEVLAEIDAIISGKIYANLFANDAQHWSNGNDDHDAKQMYHSLPPTISTTTTTIELPEVKRFCLYRFSLEKLKSLQLDQLQDLCEDLECKIQRDSEALIKELALRDELEYEKEVKSQFISLMLSIQNKRKQYFQKQLQLQQQQQNGDHHQEQQQQLSNTTTTNTSISTTGRRMRYLTTVIPYCRSQGAGNNVTVLLILIKILKAMLDNSPTVPTLLTDYILKHICPPETSSRYYTTITNGINNNNNTSSSSKTLSQLTTSLNKKIKAARRSFSFGGGGGGSGRNDGTNGGTGVGGGGSDNSCNNNNHHNVDVDDNANNHHHTNRDNLSIDNVRKCSTLLLDVNPIVV